MSTDALLMRLGPIFDSLTDSRGIYADSAHRKLEEDTIRSPGEVVLALAQVCALGVGGYQADVRRLASILVNNTAFKEMDDLYLNPANPMPTSPFDIMPERMRARIEQVLCTGLEDEMDTSLRKALGTTAAKWAKESAKRQRPCIHMPPVLLKLTHSERPFHRFTPFQIIAEYPTLLADSVTDASFKGEDLAQVLHAGLHDPSVDVKVETMKAIQGTIREGALIKDKSHKTALLLEACNVLATLSRPTLDSALEPILDIATEYPSLFMPFLDVIVPYLLSLMSPPQWNLPEHQYSPYPLSDMQYAEWLPVANQASECLLAMIQAHPADFNIEERRGYIDSLAGLYIAHQICGFEDQMCREDWLAVTDPDQPDDEYPEYPEEALERLSWALGSGTLLDALAKHMTSLIRHPDWRAKYCMLRALAVVVEGLEASMRESLDVIYNEARTDDHPRVRYGWLSLIQELATQCSGALQKRYMLQVISQCAELLDDPVPRNKVYATMTLSSIFYVHYADYMSDIGVEHVEAVNAKIFEVSRSASNHLCIAMFRLFATMAECVPDQCQTVYDQWMQVMIGMATVQGDAVSVKTQAVALEVATQIGIAMGKEAFARGYAMGVSKALCQVRQSLKGEDDPRREAVIVGWHNVSCVLGNDIEPLLHEIVDPLLDIASRPLFADLKPNQQPSKADMDQRCLALQMLGFYAQMGAIFQPWLEQTFKVVLVSLLPPNSAEVIENAAFLVPALCYSTRLSQMIDARTKDITAAFNRMLDSLNVDKKYEVSSILYKATGDMFRALQCHPPPGALRRMLMIADAQIDQFIADRRDRREGNEDEDEDERPVDERAYARQLDEDENQIMGQMRATFKYFNRLTLDNESHEFIESVLFAIESTVGMSPEIMELEQDTEEEYPES